MQMQAVDIPNPDRPGPRAAPAYAELHARSNFSFLAAASHPEELVERAAALGYAALAITDECSLAGVVRAHCAAREAGLELLIGAELALLEGPRVVLLAADRAGYARLASLITAARRAAAKGAYRRPGLAELGGEGLLALLLDRAAGGALPAAEHGEALAARFPGRAWLAVELLRGPDDAAHLRACERLAARAGLVPVAAGGVRMHVRGRRALLDVLTAVRHRCTLAEAGRRLAASGEAHLRPRPLLARIYPRELLAESVRVAARCRFSLAELRYEYPEELVPAGLDPATHLRRLTEAGARRRWPGGVPARVRALIERELALIGELGYEPYFLTVHELVEFARERGILCQGRGSAANSAVCYCLGITEVDPARMEVLFERFVSRERAEPPDIDVDFEHQRREEVIQHIYRKYGRERAALAAAVIRYRPRSAVRDVGRALGLGAAQVERLARSLAWWDGRRVVPERLAECGLDPDGPLGRRLAALVETLVGFPRHLSQHSGGFVIARGRLSELVPIENAAMPGRTVIQWDKDDLAALGLLKVDCLALGMLTAIGKALALAGAWRGQPLTLASIPAEDPEVYAMLRRADTVGVFQVESRAQQAMLPRLAPRCFYDLVIEVAIVRPGPIQGGMVHPYLRRRQGLEPVRYPSPEVREVLERTLGVPIFQEQVMRLAVVAAGFTPGEADRLRRAMAAWRRRGGLERFEQRLVEGMRARGYEEAFARALFAQIEGFGEYGFPESHAASFALLVYCSAWLKCHHPAAFTAALLNSQPLGFHAPAQLVADARRHGVEVRPVDVTASAWDCTLEAAGAGGSGGPPALRLGLRLVKGLGRAAAERVVAARQGGALRDLDDLARRARLGRAELERLAAAGALAALAGHRHRARWAALGVDCTAPPLLAGAAPGEAEPLLERPGEGESLVADYATLGLTLGRHPVALLRARLRRMRCLSAAEVGERGHRQAARAAGLVIHRQRPATAGGVVFLTLEDETGQVNVVVRPRLLERRRRELLAARLLVVAGSVERDGAVVHLVAGELEDHSPLLGALAWRSRDFR